MQRYKLIEYADASPETQAVYDDYMSSTGATFVPVWLKSLGHNAAMAHGYWERAKGTLLSGNLPLPLKEMIVFVVSALHGAKYCAACHAQAVLHLDKNLEFKDLQALLQPNSGFQLPEYYRSVVEFVSKIVKNVNAVSDADFENLMDDGFNQQEICEIIGVIDMASMFNVYTSALRLDLDPAYSAIL